MVSQKYRWDFIGLSTDTKPTSETSDKVVNGSTYYCSDTSKLYVYCDGTWYERKPLGGGGGGGTSDFNDLSNRPKYNGSDMTGSTNIPEVVTYSDFTGTDGTAAGTAGLVPAPTTTDAGKFLKADGTWDTAGGGSGPTVVQTTGTSTTDVMSQNATTSMVYADPETKRKVKIASTQSTVGNDSVAIGYGSSATPNNTIALGKNAFAAQHSSMAIGLNASANGSNSIALGRDSVASAGELAIGTSSGNGYNNSQYRLLTGVYDPQSAHDAATKGYVDAITLTNAGAPTTSTVGTVGQLLEDTTNGKLYICTDTTGGTYTWEEVGAGGGGGPTVVQTTGASQTDVMSQNAVTSLIYANPGTENKVAIGGANKNSLGVYGISIGLNASGAIGATDTVSIGNTASTSGTGGVSIGTRATAGGDNSVAVGRSAQVNNANGSVALGYNANVGSSHYWSVALGANSSTSSNGEVSFGGPGVSGLGYNSSNYRLITNVYDPQSAHDAATKGYVDPTTDSSAPTTATVGRLGQIQIDTTTATAYMCVAVDTVTPAYTWKQITA